MSYDHYDYKASMIIKINLKIEKNSQDAEMYKTQKKMRTSKTLIQKYENNEKNEKKKKCYRRL